MMSSLGKVSASTVVIRFCTLFKAYFEDCGILYSENLQHKMNDQNQISEEENTHQFIAEEDKYLEKRERILRDFLDYVALQTYLE